MLTLCHVQGHAELSEKLEAELLGMESLTRLVEDEEDMLSGVAAAKKEKELKLVDIEEREKALVGRVGSLAESIGGIEAEIVAIRGELESAETSLPALESKKKTAAAARDFKAAGALSAEIKALLATKEKKRAAAERLEGEVVGKREEKSREEGVLEGVLGEKAEVEKVGGESLCAVFVKRVEMLRAGWSDGARGAIVQGEIDLLLGEVERICKEFGFEVDVGRVGEVEEDVEGGGEVAAKEEKLAVEPDSSESTEDTAQESEEEAAAVEAAVEEEAAVAEVVAAEEVVVEETAVSSAPPPPLPRVEDDLVSLVKALTLSISEAEDSIGEAVEADDYERAAELDEEIQVAKAKIEEMGLSEEDLAWALEQ